MSKASSSPAPVPSSKATSSAWAKGPPAQTTSPLPASPALSAARSGAGTPLPNGAQNTVNQSGSAQSHSRKPSIMAIGADSSTTKGVDIRLRSGNPQPINFGSLDSPNTALSSSPAAPSTTGSHLDANAVKSFGTIEADASAAAQRANTASAVPAQVKKPLDMHALFGASAPTSAIDSAASQHEGRPSVPGAQAFQMPQASGSNALFNGPGGNLNTAQHLRIPHTGSQPPRSPTLGNQMPQPQTFRPVNAISGRANGQPSHGITQSVRGAGAPVQLPYGGVHPSHPQQGYPGMGGYPTQSGYYYNMYEPQTQYGVNPQWAPQQHQQPHTSQPPFGQLAMSPRNAPSALGAHGSPSPHNAGLPASGGPSPSPTPPSRPQSMAGQIHSSSPMANPGSPVPPSTPSRPLSFQGQSSPFTPHPHPAHLQQAQQAQSPASLAALSASASSFTPRRATSAIKISRPDGTAVDLEAAARAAKGPAGGSTSTSETGSPAVPDVKPEVKKPGFMPVVVRLESEEQKKVRLAEEAKEKRMKELEQQEEQDRKERKERQAREEAEKLRAKEEAADAEQVRLKDEAAAKQEIAAAEEAKAEEEGKALAEAKSREAADAKRQEAADAIVKRDADAVRAEERNAAAIAAEKQEDEGKGKAQEVASEDASVPQTTAEIPIADPVKQTPVPASSLPTASPALGSTGLPAKPTVNGVSAAAVNRTVPVALNLPSTPLSLSDAPSSDAPSSDAPASDAPASASTSALGSARNIEDLRSVSYPSNLKSPDSGLNVTTEPGKFRYDREFLLQFMEICREKPESLPPLDAIGLEADTSSSFGSGRGGARSGRPSMGPPGGRGGGIGGGRGGFPNMGNFQMGAFGSGQISRPSTSEERLAQSRMPPGGGNARMGAGQMHRSLSQGGPSQLPHMNARGGQNRSQRGTKRLPNDNRMSFNPNEPEVAPLVSTGDAWSGNRRRATVDENSPEYIERKVKSLLNKLTQEKFDSISVQILEWANKSKDETDGRTLRLVIKLIFEKATDEAHWSSMYARLCRMLLDRLSDEVSDTIDGKRISGGPLFRKYLLGRCQVDFEAGWKSREDAASAALATSEEDKARLAAKAAQGETVEAEGAEEQPQEAAMLSDEYYAAQKAKRRGLGLVQLIGELFKMEMLTKSVIVTCMIKLLSNVNDPDEEDIESTCKLLTTVGAVMERQHSSALDVFFERLKELSKSPNINSRMRFMVLDVMELRTNRWQLRNSDGGVQTIAQVHEQAAREQAKKSAAAAQSSREASSRSGSRQGHSRRNEFGGQGGSDWTPVANARLPQRQTDFSSFGRIGTQTGVPTALGPSSVFNKRKSNVPGQVTPPLSRQSSSSNMFGVLSGDGAIADVGASDGRRGSGDAGSQRKKLALLPRSKPVDGDDEKEEDEDEEGGEEGAETSTDEDEVEGTDAPSTDMSESQARAKIASDVKELWGEKDSGGSRNPEDIVDYFRALPAAFHKLLATQLVDDVFRIAKKPDAEVVANGWSKAVDAGVTTVDVLQASLLGRMESLDDDSIDFPLAYSAVAILIRGAGMSDEAIEALGNAIVVDGTPRITPKDKLQRALASLENA